MLATADIGQRLALNLPTWTLIGLAAAAVAMSLAIVSVLIRAPLRTDPDEFIPQPPRLSAAMLLAFLPLLAISIAGSVAAFRLLDVTSLSTALLLRAPPMERSYAPTRDMIDVPMFDFALTLTLGAVTAVVAAFATPRHRIEPALGYGRGLVQPLPRTEEFNACRRSEISDVDWDP